MVEPAVQGENGLDIYVNGGIPKELGDKITILNSDAAKNSLTICIRNEDHTLGNVLRYMLMKKYLQLTSPNVEFCGYSVPHPSEFQINLRIQTNGSINAIDALHKAIDQLQEMFLHIKDEFKAAK